MDMDTPVGALLFWACTALTCIERVLVRESFSPWDRGMRDRPSALDRDFDSALALLALRNMLRAAEWCARDLQQHDGEATNWIADFRRMVPDLVDARNALEHFDEYAIGRGRLQRSSPELFSFSFSEGASGPLVKVGRFSIPLQTTKDACRWLAIKLLAAYEQVLPPERRSRAEALLDEVTGPVKDEGGA